MKFAISFLLAILLVGCLGGCGGGANVMPSAGTIDGVDPNYAAYLDAQRAKEQSDATGMTAFATMAAACTDARCVEHIAAVAALSRAGGSGGDAVRGPPAPQPSRAWSFVERALGFGAQVVLGLDANETTQTLYNVFGGIVSDVSARATYQVGGDFVSGTQHVGDAYTAGNDIVQGDGNATSGGQIGDAFDGPAIVGDGNVQGDGNRFDSDDNTDSGNCDAGDGAAGGAGPTGGSGGEGGACGG